MNEHPLDKFDFKGSDRLLFVSQHSTKDRKASMHEHPEGQLFYNLSGTAALMCGGKEWILPATRALWIPPHQGHAAQSLTPVDICTVYVNPNIEFLLPLKEPRLVFVSAMLRELILSAARVPIDRPCNQREHLLMQLIIEEIACLRPEPGAFPLASDPRLKKCMNAIFLDPAKAELSVLAKKCGASPATLKRLFQQELGTTFSELRQQVRIVLSLPRLTQGISVTQAALEQGYESSASFSRAFHQVMGESPSEFRKERGC
jgi:AraC-like DNA-binding protein